MKKFFLSAVLAIAALAASAQQPVGGISLTPHVGMGYAIASEKFANDFNGFVTACAGVEATYKPTKMFGISAGLDYGYGSTFTETQKFNYENTSKKYDHYMDHYFINLPVMAQLHFGQVALKAGIQPGWVIDPKHHVDWKDGNYSANMNYNGQDDINTFQLSVPVGISYSPKFPLQFDLRYNIPVTGYMKNTEGGNFNLGTIMLTVGYRFDLGRK